MCVCVCLSVCCSAFLYSCFFVFPFLFFYCFLWCPLSLSSSLFSSLSLPFPPLLLFLNLSVSVVRRSVILAFSSFLSFSCLLLLSFEFSSIQLSLPFFFSCFLSYFFAASSPLSCACHYFLLNLPDAIIGYGSDFL